MSFCFAEFVWHDGMAKVVYFGRDPVVPLQFENITAKTKSFAEKCSICLRCWSFLLEKKLMPPGFTRHNSRLNLLGFIFKTRWNFAGPFMTSNGNLLSWFVRSGLMKKDFSLSFLFSASDICQCLQLPSNVKNTVESQIKLIQSSIRVAGYVLRYVTVLSFL